LSASRWEEVNCPICPTGTGNASYLRCSDRLQEPLFKNYQLRRCVGCGLVYLNPRPLSDDAAEHYPEAGYDPFLSLNSGNGLFDRAYRISRCFTLAWKQRLVKRLTPRGSGILDVGCGTGEFLDALKTDYQTMGIEPEPNAAKWARERLGLTVYTGGWEALPTGETNFDLITMWHVLEHIPDPLATLRAVAERLTPAGKLLIALPNIAALDAAIYRSEWVALDAPRHLWHFTPATLTRLASQAGFILKYRGMLPLDPFYNILGSERLKVAIHGRWQVLLTPLRASFAALASMIWGLTTGNHSGIIYIFARQS
jgi:2-polyprenyl-3-methyl-5-hydroxy-6-metoxy-1,4-benzoquinol methylase